MKTKKQFLFRIYNYTCMLLALRNPFSEISTVVSD